MKSTIRSLLNHTAFASRSTAVSVRRMERKVDRLVGDMVRVKVTMGRIESFLGKASAAGGVEKLVKSLEAVATPGKVRKTVEELASFYGAYGMAVFTCGFITAAVYRNTNMIEYFENRNDKTESCANDLCWSC